MNVDFHKQTHNACLAYALWNVGAITEKDVHDYEKGVLPVVELLGAYSDIAISLQWQWVTSVVPNWSVDEFLTQAGVLGAMQSNIEIAGKTGVLIVGMFEKENNYQYGSHALSIVDGKVLDPDGDGQLETWNEYIQRKYCKEGISVVEIRKLSFWEKTA